MIALTRDNPSPPTDATSACAPGVGRPHAIGPLQLATNLLLAPVANYCDLAFRIVCREQGGLGLACTDLLSPQGLLRGTAESLDLARTNDEDSPICMQLYGADPAVLAEGAVWAVEHGADVVDINMGCPVDKVTKKDGGSKLLCDPERTVRTTERVVQAVDRASRGRVPTTAKLRLGWDDSCIVAPELARSLERVGVQQITVHGRTTEMRFKGEVRHAGIREVVEAVDRIPVIGNGDVTTPEACLDMLNRTGCRGVMIGRGAFAAPWLFNQCWQFQTTGRYDPDPSEAHKVDLIRRYFALMRTFRDDHYAMTHIRRRISWFGKRLGPCKPLKEAVRLAASPDDVLLALDAFQAGGLRVFRDGAAVGLEDEHVRRTYDKAMAQLHSPPADTAVALSATT